MKSNREWFNLLTKKEQEQFKRNCDELNLLLNWEIYKNEFSENFFEFVSGGFTWYKTDDKTQGNDYWSKIANSNRTIKDVTNYDED